jgi:Protein of unknown function (DUF3313)
MDNYRSSGTALLNTERGVRSCQVAGRAVFSHFVSLSLFAGLLLIGLTALAQDSSQAQDPTKAQQRVAKYASGFLADYSKLEPDPKNSDLLIYWQNPDALKNSSKFIIAPVIVYLLPETQRRGIDPEDLAKLTQYFTKAVTEELTKGGRYEIVTESGPGVVELRLAITDVEPTGGKTNAAVKGAAVAATTAAAPGAAMLVPRISVGKVAIEGEMVDSVSQGQLVEFMTSKSGRRMFSGLNAYKKWGDIEAAFRAWAKNFRERLDKAHES